MFIPRMQMPADAPTDGRAIEVTGDPIPTKFDAPEERLIRQIKLVTGLPLSHVIKRCAKFALPKFASGEVNILTLTDSVTLDGSKERGGNGQ